MYILSEQYKLCRKYSWYSRLLRTIDKWRVRRLLPGTLLSDSQIVDKARAEKQLVIQVLNGGIGDHLAYSSLPELLWTQKRIQVFLSSSSIFRNAQIFEYAWAKNPFVKMTDQKGWFIHQPLDIIQKYKTINHYLVNLFDLEGDDAPKLYYQPVVIPELEGQVVVDCSCGPSGKSNGYFDPEFYEAYLNYLEKNIPSFVLLTYPNLAVNSVIQKKVIEKFNPRIYPIRGLEGLSDALFSASRRYLLYSGSASIAAGYILPSVVLCNWKSSPNFQYRINEYVDIVEHGCKSRRGV